MLCSRSTTNSRVRLKSIPWDARRDTVDDVSHIVPILEILALHHAILRSAGRDPAECSMKNTTEQGVLCHCRCREGFARNVKEKLCYIASNYDTVPTSTRGNDKENLRLSDGNTITIGAERVRCAKVLFQPILTVRGQRIPRHFFPVFMKCDVANRTGIVHQCRVVRWPGERMTKN